MFMDGHAVKRKTCVGKPCQLKVHAEQVAVSDFARQGMSLKGAELQLAHVPCMECAHLMSMLDLGRLWLLKAPKTDDEEAVWEMLSMRYPVTVSDARESSFGGSKVPSHSAEIKTPRKSPGAVTKASKKGATSGKGKRKKNTGDVHPSEPKGTTRDGRKSPLNQRWKNRSNRLLG